MKVLLISPNVEHLPDPVFPIGAAYLVAALKAAGIPCQTLDLCFEADMAQALVAALHRQQPDLIALSLRNVDNVSYPHAISYLAFYHRLMTVIRENSPAPVVVGGSGFTLLPEAIFNYLQADFGICGEGEIALVRLVRHLEGQQPFSALARSPIIRPDRALIEELDTLAVPDRTAFDSRRYLQRGGMGNLQTKRGCPFHCIYCTYPLIEGCKARTRSPVRIGDEIEAMLDQGIDTFFIVDNEFNYPPAHAMAVCREIVQRRLAVKWSCYANPAFMTPALAEQMMAAGCSGVEFGTDTACEAMLQNMGKNFAVADIVKASEICRRSGLSFCHSLLLGGPGETMDTVAQTLETIVASDPTAVICMVGIRIFPQTQLADHALAEGHISADEDFLKPVFYLSEAIAATILPFLERFAHHHPTWILPGLQINMNSTLQQKLRRFGVKGPLWEYMRIAKRFAATPKP